MKTILVLDDEPYLVRLMSRVLRHYTVREAATVGEAERRIHEVKLDIQLLIADITLPDGSGTDVALLCRHENPALPVILTSGYPVSCWPTHDVANFEKLQSGSLTILSKPFQASTLLDRVRDLIGEPVT